MADSLTLTEGKAQLARTLMMALVNSGVPVSHDSESEYTLTGP